MYEPLRLERRIFVPIPEKKTAELEIPYAPEGEYDQITENTTLAACQTQMRMCNGRLGDISRIEGTLAPDEKEKQ